MARDSTAMTPDRQGQRSVDGRYALVRFLGQGAMGEVWRAQDLLLDQSVAIKLPRRGRVAGSERWLAAEAQSVARLSHPNIVALLDRTTLLPLTEDEERTDALVLEYVAGKALTHWTGRARPWSFVRSVANQALEALAYAHGRGVVHRDLKPGNVLLSGESGRERVSLLDFGVAAWLRDEDDGDRPSGTAPGTRRAMAPEQALGDRGDIGPWTDLYAFGLLLAELLLGRYPLPGRDEDEIWSVRLRTRFAPPAQALADLGVPIRRYLLRLLAPDPAQRFGWARDAIRALPELDAGESGAVVGFRAEATDVLQAVRRPTDDEDEGSTGADDEGTDASIEEVPDPSGRTPSIFRTGGSVTLELAPAAEEEVVLPPSWALDRPDPAAWDAGLDRHEHAPDRAVPAASYGLFSLREPPLLGRRDEWRVAWAHLRDQLSQRRPALVVVQGPQGRGRTRFAREIGAVAEELGVARAHHVRLRADGTGSAALRRLLHRVLRLADLDSSEREDRLRRVLAEAGYPSEADLVPRLCHLLEGGEGTVGLETEAAATAVELFAVLGRRRPLLLFLEDVDRARDRSLLGWLEGLLEATGPAAVGVVATMGPDADGEVDEMWAALLARKGSVSIPMEPLGDAAVASVLGFTAGLHPQLSTEIARWTGGDPRAAQQAARHLHESGRLRWTKEGFELRADTPSTAGLLRLDSILLARARDFVRSSADSDATATVLDLLALVRERARHEDLLAAGERVGIEPRRLEAALAPLVLGALVDVRDEGPRLVHLALRGRLHAAMDERRRLAFHRAWASVLETSHGSLGHAERMLEAAAHREGCGQEPAAARDELSAAHLLRQRGELRAAERATASARSRIRRQPDLLRPEEEADLLTLEARLEHELAVPPATPSALASSLDMLQPMWATLPPTVERCRCDLVHAEALRRAGRPKDALEALQRCLDGARSLKAKEWESRALAALSNLLRPVGDLYRADALADQAQGLAEASGDDALLREVLQSRLRTAIARQDADGARQYLDRMRSVLRARASFVDLQNLWLLRGNTELLIGQPDAARQAWMAALALARRRELDPTPVLVELAALALSGGDLTSAAARIDEAAALAVAPSHEEREALAILRAELACRTGAANADAALLDAEILRRQQPLSAPSWLRSLERARAKAPAALAPRLDALIVDMKKRLELGAGPRKSRR